MIVVFFIIVFGVANLFSQHNEIFEFRHYSLDEGLSQSTVFTIVQDPQGFIWVGTEDGLNRFDGYEFKVLKHRTGDPTSLSGNYIYTLALGDSDYIWIGTRQSGLNRLNLRTWQFQSWDLYDSLTAHHSNYIRTIVPSRSGIVWIGTDDTGLWKFDPRSGAFRCLLGDGVDGTTLPARRIWALLEDQRGNLWIGTRGQGVICRSPDGRFTVYRQRTKTQNGPSSDHVVALYEDRAGNIWMGTTRGLDKYNPNTGTWQHWNASPDYKTNPYVLSYRTVLAILEDQRGYIWIGTYGGGVNILDPQSGKIRHMLHDPLNLRSLNHDYIWSLFEDRSGGIWIGTRGGGLNYYHPNMRKFQHWHHIPGNPNSLSHDDIWAVLEDHRGRVWIGTNGGGLNIYDPATKRYQILIHNKENPNSISHNRIWALEEDRQGNIWVGSSNGLTKIDSTLTHFQHWRNEPGKPQWFPSNRVQALLADSTGGIWVGTLGGLAYLRPDSGTSRIWVPDEQDSLSLIHPNVRSIFIDSRNTLWCGTLGGLERYLPESNGFRHYTVIPGDTHSLSNDVVLSIMEDSRGRLWIGTMGGLNRYIREADAFEQFTEDDGLPNNVVYGILEDANGYLWLSTNRGISRFDPNTKTFKNFDVRDGLQGNEFNQGAYADGRSGKMYFGGANGLTVFDPLHIPENTFVPPVVITEFLINNKPVPVGPKSLLPQALPFTRDIRISYKDNIFAFRYAVLNFLLPEKNQYAYKLEGFDEDWQYVGNRRLAIYTNISPGEYVFRVKGSNNDGIWNETGAAIRLYISTPPWKTWWAYLLYVIVVTGLAYTIYSLRMRVYREQLESEKLKEINEEKSKFYQNISHEFRTPLTLIMGPLEGILNGKITRPGRELFEMIYRNARQLYHLINQLLDLSKIESGQLELKKEPVVINTLIERQGELFRSLADQKHIVLDIQVPNDPLVAEVDVSAFEKMLNNLLSNALKFTPEQGRVEVELLWKERCRINGPCIEIQVRDTGIGIPRDKLEKIFERFYQVDGTYNPSQPGTGIGLALTREIVERHGGTIWVESEERVGTTFGVQLPLYTGEKPPRSPETELSLEDDVVMFAGTPSPIRENDVNLARLEKPLVLVVEDHADMREYIRSVLEPDMVVVEAPDGDTGLEKAFQYLPDLIISDVMMPRLSGFEFCEKVKQDERTNHIPVILLTARGSEKSQITGYRLGADAYVTKPFNASVLKEQVKTLIRQRKALAEKFSRQLLGDGGSGVPAEDPFLKKALQVIEEHLADADFTVEQFAQEMGLSRTQLHRKLKATVDKNATEFLRYVRLTRAAAMFRNGYDNVTEVAYSTGFNSLSYFARLFKEQFGASPSQYIRKHKKRTRQ